MKQKNNCTAKSKCRLEERPAPQRHTANTARRVYWTLAPALALAFLLSPSAFAAGDPLTVINNLSTFIFSLIRAVGMILLG